MSPLASYPLIEMVPSASGPSDQNQLSGLKQAVGSDRGQVHHRQSPGGHPVGGPRQRTSRRSTRIINLIQLFKSLRRSRLKGQSGRVLRDSFGSQWRTVEMFCRMGASSVFVFHLNRWELELVCKAQAHVSI